MTQETAETTKKIYAKPAFMRIASTQVLLDLLERAESDQRLATDMSRSIHQADPEYRAN